MNEYYVLGGPSCVGNMNSLEINRAELWEIWPVNKFLYGGDIKHQVGSITLGVLQMLNKAGCFTLSHHFLSLDLLEWTELQYYWDCHCGPGKLFFSSCIWHFSKLILGWRNSLFSSQFFFHDQLKSWLEKESQ